MLTGVQTGNADTDGAANRSWFVGPFMPAATGLRRAPIEVKWSHWRKGDSRGWDEGSEFVTLAMCVSGAQRYWFDGRTEPKAALFGPQPDPVDLLVPGDYVIWEPGIRHDWEALDDCTVLNIRWRADR